MGARQSKTGVTSVEVYSDVGDSTQTRRSRFRTVRPSSQQVFHQGVPSEDSDTYRFVDGRRYTDSSRTANLLPVIEEVDKQRQQHNLFKRIWGANYSAPIKMRLRGGGARVLDVGCGIGTWTVEMAKEYPYTGFTGVDVAPVFPSPSERRPINARFLQCDIFDGLPFTDGTFDFVFMRRMTGCFSEREFEDKVIKELVRVVKPGGWIEIFEVDNELVNPGPIAQQLTHALTDYLDTQEIITSVNPYIPKYLESNKKLTGIQSLEKSCFLGKWAGKVGQLAVEDMTKSWKAWRLPMSEMMGLNHKEYDELVRAFGKELEHLPKTLFKTWRFYAQKEMERHQKPTALVVPSS